MCSMGQPPPYKRTKGAVPTPCYDFSYSRTNHRHWQKPAEGHLKAIDPQAMGPPIEPFSAVGVAIAVLDVPQAMRAAHAPLAQILRAIRPDLDKHRQGKEPT